MDILQVCGFFGHLPQLHSLNGSNNLLYLSSQQNDTPELQLQIGKAQLAALLGTIPETLSRILTKMAKQGLIESAGATIKIVDREELEHLAAGDKRLS